MNTMYRNGAIGALLDEYEKAIAALKFVISDIKDAELATIVDERTEDERCKSVQSVLAHVVNSGYGYAVYIRCTYLKTATRPANALHTTAEDFQHHLDDMFTYNVETLSQFNDNQLEEFDEAKKILTGWGQYYDIEQMMEHAIVHILRHRRQIEKFKILLRSNQSA